MSVEILHCATCQHDVELRRGRLPAIPCPECHRPLQLLGSPAAIARTEAALDEEESRLP